MCVVDLSPFTHVMYSIGMVEEGLEGVTTASLAGEEAEAITITTEEEGEGEGPTTGGTDLPFDHTPQET